MVCGFLENLSLSSLIAPVAVEEFRSRYWERQPLVVNRKDPDYYYGLFNLEDFEEAITRSPDYVKLANAATSKNVSYKAAMTEGLEAVLGDMRAGGTLLDAGERERLHAALGQPRRFHTSNRGIQKLEA